jgi:hypothetical protein
MILARQTRELTRIFSFIYYFLIFPFSVIRVIRG